MDDFTFTTPNLAQYEQHLLDMGAKQARAIGRAAVRRGINVIMVESRRLATAGHPNFPNEITGRMARSIYTHDQGIIGDNIVFSVDVKKLAFYARFVEFGTSHAKAYPFMRVAASTKAQEAVQVMASYMGSQIEMGWGRF